MFDGRWRHRVDKATKPVGTALVRIGVTADVLTFSGLIFSGATAIVIATGHLRWGIPLLTLTGLNDLFDGPVAKAGGTSSLRGAFFDSVADRVSDAVIMGGVFFYLIGIHEGDLAVLPLCVLGAASTVSYTRAKAEALGFPKVNAGIAGSLMERAERMILLGVGLLSRSFLVPVLWVLFALTLVTAFARFFSVWKVADRPPRRTVPERTRHTARRFTRASITGAQKHHAKMGAQSDPTTPGD